MAALLPLAIIKYYGIYRYYPLSPVSLAGLYLFLYRQSNSIINILEDRGYFAIILPSLILQLTFSYLYMPFQYLSEYIL